MWFRPSLFKNKIGQDWPLLTFVKEKKWGEREKKRWPGQELLLRKLSIKQGLCRSRKKSQNFVGFLETNLQQNWPILRKAHSAEIFWANLLESNRFCADFRNVFNETRRNFAHFWWEGKWIALACAITITTETLTTYKCCLFKARSKPPLALWSHLDLVFSLHRFFVFLSEIIICSFNNNELRNVPLAKLFISFTGQCQFFAIII